MHGQGGRAGAHLRSNCLCVCARKIIKEYNLLFQSEVRSLIPVQIPILQGTGKTIYTDRAGVKPRYCNLYLDVDPSTYM